MGNQIFLTSPPSNVCAAICRMRYNLPNRMVTETGRGYFAVYYVKSVARWKMLLKDIWQLTNVLLKRRVTLSRYRQAVTQQCEYGLKTRSRPLERSRLKGKPHTAPVTLIR